MTVRSDLPNKATADRSILRVDKSAGRWEAIPTALINDARLGFDTRGFAAWLLARPDGWQIHASCLPRLLKVRSDHVGRDKVRRFLRELERAGYLARSRRHSDDGRWFWDYAFRPTSQCTTIDAFSVDGSPVDGKGVDIPQTLNNSRSDQSRIKKTTTTTEPECPESESKPVIVVGDLIEIRYPDCLTGSRLASARQLVARCPGEHAQAVLDELGAMVNHGGVRHPLGLLNRLIEKAKVGEFVPNRSLTSSPSRAASNVNLKASPGDDRAAMSQPNSQPRIASDIAEKTLFKLHARLKSDAK